MKKHTYPPGPPQYHRTIIVRTGGDHPWCRLFVPEDARLAVDCYQQKKRSGIHKVEYVICDERIEEEPEG